MMPEREDLGSQRSGGEFSSETRASKGALNTLCNSIQNHHTHATTSGVVLLHPPIGKRSGGLAG